MSGKGVRCEADEGSKGGAEITYGSHEWDTRKKPICFAPSRVHQHYRVWIRKELGKMSKDGVIMESNSSWGAPIVLVRKKDETTRLCVDYQRLNSLTALNAYPKPCIEELINKLGGTIYLTTLDLAWGYWLAPMAKNANKKMTFITPHSLFRFEVMPFG